MTVDTEKIKALALAASDIEPWQVRCDWASNEPATRLMVAAMKAENADLRAEVERLEEGMKIAINGLQNIAAIEARSAPAAGTEKDAEIDERYEFERYMSQRGDATEYIGDGMYSLGSVQDQWEAWLGRAAIGAHTKAGKDGP